MKGGNELRGDPCMPLYLCLAYSHAFHTPCVPDPLLNLTTFPAHRDYFQMKADPPRDQWRAVKMTVQVASTADLWRVCLKSKWATIEIPELEFEISADGKRHTDSIYNHIASAVYNLGNYVSVCLCLCVCVGGGGGGGGGGMLDWVRGGQIC
jgi:hypothetical protein